MTYISKLIVLKNVSKCM